MICALWWHTAIVKLPRWTHVGRVSVVASALAIALIGGLLVGIIDRSDNAGASAVTVSAQDIATEPGPDTHPEREHPLLVSHQYSAHHD